MERWRKDKGTHFQFYQSASVGTSFFFYNQGSLIILAKEHHHYNFSLFF